MMSLLLVFNKVERAIHRMKSTHDFNLNCLDKVRLCSCGRVIGSRLGKSLVLCSLGSGVCFSNGNFAKCPRKDSLPDLEC